MGVDGRDVGGLPMAECEPDEWFVIFHRETTRWWLRWLAWGKYKHVSMAGFVRRAGTWVMIDYQVGQQRVYLVSDHESSVALGWFIGAHDVVKMPAGDRAGQLRIRVSVPGLWCVPATAHVLGLKTCALRPDALFAHCLAQGGQLIGAATDESARTGPGSRKAAQDRGAGEGGFDEAGPVHADA